MLRSAARLKGCSLEASDGAIGKVTDCLFDDSSWKVRWLVVETGSWLTGRQVLIHPSSVDAVDEPRQEISVRLTRQKVRDSPRISTDRPVSRQMENSLTGYYGWSSYYGGGLYGMGAIASPLSAPPYFGGMGMGEAGAQDVSDADADPHLRSLAEVDGYHIQASDGAIGHIEDLIVDDASWDVGYLVVDTANWWAGQHVLVSVHAVQDIRWGDRQMLVNVSREQIKASPSRDDLTKMNVHNNSKAREHHYHD